MWYNRRYDRVWAGSVVTSSDDTFARAEFAVTFVGAPKVAGSYDDLKRRLVNVGGLKDFLKNGAVPVVIDSKALARITGKARDFAKVDGI